MFRPLALCSLIVVPSALQLISTLLLAWRRLTAYLPITLAMLVATVLRFWSLDWQLPYLLHNDERGYISTAMIMWAHGDANPHHFVNPSVLFYIDAIFFNLFGGSRSESFRIFLETFGRQFWDPNGVYLVALASRSFVATLGVSTVAAAYLAAKELFGKQTGFFASLFLAVSFLHVRNSHYGTTDIPATALATFSFLFAARIYRTGHLSDYILAGVLGGLATSTKYNAGMFVLPILAAHLARQKGIGLQGASTRFTARNRMVAKNRLCAELWIHLPLVASFFISGIAFVMATPFSLLDWGAFSRDFRAQYGYGSSPWGTQDALPTWWMQLATLVHGFGLVPLIFASIGIIWALKVQIYDPTKDPTPWTRTPERPAYVVTSSFGWELIHRRLANANAAMALDPYKQLTEDGQLVASFSPGNGEAQVEYSIDDTYTPFWHLMSYKRPGPTVHIFRFD